ncbi:hypothetical protein E3N88_33754 [Mikania micrantha]|uniref:BSD domain-containing protein n=1 Tax=Mikania micrantha TaxID=192012 RepID=A0A5N6MCW8_9ASTR|nr:hypothetical protein E3N88_33754 [Mikania micrantha]
MDFFRSILADDPDTLGNHRVSNTDLRQNESPKHQETEGDEDDDDSTSNVNSSDDGTGGGGLWSFGDLVKTLTTKSESVFETYRRDLKEFGTGLRKESDLFREVASRAVKELPTSIEVGTSAIDGVLKSTADIIAQGKEVLLAPSDVDDSDASDRRISSDRSGLDSMRFSRFDAQLNVIRSDSRAFCEDPEDLDDYNSWKLGFVIGDKKDEIENLVGDNGPLEAIYSKIVPGEVDDATFWFRYFYKVHKLKQQEEVRAKLVKRSLSVDDDEELSWDVDDEDQADEDQKQAPQQQQQADPLRSNTSKNQDSDDFRKNESTNDEVKTQSSEIVCEDKEMMTNVVSIDKSNVEELKFGEGNVSTIEKAESVPKSDEKVDLKADSGEIKDSSVTFQSQSSFQEDEDLEWDEIEDLGKADDQIVSHGESTNKADLRKRLSTTVDEDEDLSWDIEDDDEPLKPGNN